MSPELNTINYTVPIEIAKFYMLQSFRLFEKLLQFLKYYLKRNSQQNSQSFLIQSTFKLQLCVDQYNFQLTHFQRLKQSMIFKTKKERLKPEHQQQTDNSLCETINQQAQVLHIILQRCQQQLNSRKDLQKDFSPIFVNQVSNLLQKNQEIVSQLTNFLQDLRIVKLANFIKSSFRFEKTVAKMLSERFLGFYEMVLNNQDKKQINTVHLGKASKNVKETIFGQNPDLAQYQKYIYEVNKLLDNKKGLLISESFALKELVELGCMIDEIHNKISRLSNSQHKIYIPMRNSVNLMDQLIDQIQNSMTKAKSSFIQKFKVLLQNKNKTRLYSQSIQVQTDIQPQQHKRYQRIIVLNMTISAAKKTASIQTNTVLCKKVKIQTGISNSKQKDATQLQYPCICLQFRQNKDVAVNTTQKVHNLIENKNIVSQTVRFQFQNQKLDTNTIKQQTPFFNKKTSTIKIKQKTTFIKKKHQRNMSSKFFSKQPSFRDYNQKLDQEFDMPIPSTHFSNNQSFRKASLVQFYKDTHKSVSTMQRQFNQRRIKDSSCYMLRTSHSRNKTRVTTDSILFVTSHKKTLKIQN